MCSQVNIHYSGHSSLLELVFLVSPTLLNMDELEVPELVIQSVNLLYVYMCHNVTYMTPPYDLFEHVFLVSSALFLYNVHTYNGP